MAGGGGGLYNPPFASGGGGGGAAGTNTFGISNLGNTSGTSGVITGTALRMILAGGNNITLSQSINGSSATVTISAFNQTQESQSFGMSNLGNTSGTTGIASGPQVAFFLAGGNNITLSQSLNGASGTITISAFNQSNQQMTLFATGNTTQSSTGTTNASSIIFRGEGNVSVGITNGSIVVSGAGGGGGGTPATTISRVESANVLGTNTARYAIEDHQHEGVYAAGMSNLGNQFGDTGVRPGRLVLVGMGAISLSGATAAGSLQTVSISVQSQTNQLNSAFAVGNTTQSSSFGPIDARSWSFRGEGIASVGISGGSVVISVPSGGGAGDGGVFAGVSTFGNTAGSTGTVSTGNFVLVGSNGISLSQSTGAAGSAATVTIHDAPYHSFYNPLIGANTVMRGFDQGSMFFAPFQISHPVQHDRFAFEINFSNSSNSTGSLTLSVSIGLFTRSGVSTLNLISSTSSTWAWTFSGSVGNSSLQAGYRLMTIPWTNTITIGDYWLGYWNRSTSAGTNATLQIGFWSSMNTNYLGIMSQASNQSNQIRLGLGPRNGSFSTAMPGSLHFSSIQGNAAGDRRQPHWFVLSQTV